MYIHVHLCAFRLTIFHAIDQLPIQNGCEFPCSASSVQHVPVIDAVRMTDHGLVKKTLKLSLDISVSITCFCSPIFVCSNEQIEYTIDYYISHCCYNHCTKIEVL